MATGLWGLLNFNHTSLPYHRAVRGLSPQKIYDATSPEGKIGGERREALDADPRVNPYLMIVSVQDEVAYLTRKV